MFQPYLQQRDQREIEPFEELIAAYSDCLQCEEESAEVIEGLKQQLGRLERKLSSAESDIQAFQQQNIGSVDAKQLAHLEEKYERLKEERTELYRSQSINTQKLLDMNDQIKAKESMIQQLEQELKDRNALQAKLERRIADHQGLIEEKNLNIQIMQDELTALQLELLNSEERNSSTKSPSSLQSPSTNEGQTQSSLYAAQHLNLQTSRPFDMLFVKLSFRLAVACEGSVQIYAVDSTIKSPSYAFTLGEESKQLTLKMILNSTSNATIGSLASSACNNLLAGTSYTSGADSSIVIWNLTSGRIKCVLGGHEGPTVGSVFLPENKLASAGRDGTIRIWDVSQGLGLRTINAESCCDILGLPQGESYKKLEMIVYFTLYNRTIVTSHLDGKLRLWDHRMAKAASAWSVCPAGIDRISMAKDEIMCSCPDNVIRVWDLAAHKVKQSFAEDGFVSGSSARPVCSSDGHFVAAASANGLVHIWNRTSKGGRLEDKIEVLESNDEINRYAVASKQHSVQPVFHRKTDILKEALMNKQHQEILSLVMLI